MDFNDDFMRPGAGAGGRAVPNFGFNDFSAPFGVADDVSPESFTELMDAFTKSVKNTGIQVKTPLPLDLPPKTERLPFASGSGSEPSILIPVPQTRRLQFLALASSFPHQQNLTKILDFQN